MHMDSAMLLAWCWKAGMRAHDEFNEQVCGQVRRPSRIPHVTGEETDFLLRRRESLQLLNEQFFMKCIGHLPSSRLPTRNFMEVRKLPTS